MAEENNNDENLPQPKPFPPEMVEDAESKTVAHQVRDYLWGKGPIDYPLVSAHLNRDLVSRFVEFEIRDLPPEFFWRVRILADLYNLIEQLNFIQSFLKRQENKPEDLDRSVAGIIILEEIGDEPQKKFAAQYYEFLVSHPLANQKFEELLECLEVLGSRVAQNPLHTRMEQEIKILASRESSDPEAEVEKRVVEELVLNEFFFIGETNKSRARILAIADANQRLLELIRAYLELTDDAGGDYFKLWLQQQIRRAAEAEGNEKVIKAFRFIVTTLGKMPSADEIFCKVRCYNAIEFFLGKLTAEEELFMNKNRQKQIDPLRYMPVPLHIEDVEEEEMDDDETENEDEN